MKVTELDESLDEPEEVVGAALAAQPPAVANSDEGFQNALMGSIHCLAGAIRTQKDDPKTARATMKPFSSLPFKTVVRRLALVAGHVKAPRKLRLSLRAPTPLA